MQIKIDCSEKKRQTFFNKIANTKPLMRELSLMGLSAIQKNIENGIKPDNAPLTKAVKQGNNTLRDTGRLRSSLTARHTATEAAVGTNVPYARIHNPEDGRTKTVIRPKKATYLCLPASPTTRTLYRRYGFSARDVITGLQSNGVAVFRPYKRGTTERANIILMQKKGKKAEVIFILKKSITVPARPFMFLPDNVINTMLSRVEDYYAS